MFFALLTGIVPVLAQNGNWQVTASLTRGLRGGQAVLVDSTIYVLGGYSDSTQTAVDWIQKFDPLTGKFTLVGRMKKKRVAHTAVVLGKNIYYAGGEYYNTRNATGTIEVFNTESKITASVDSNLTFNRYAMAGVISDSVFYFIGGEPYSQWPHGGSANYPYIVEYNLSRRQITYNFTALFSNENLRAGQMVALANNYIYIFGGAYNTILSSIYRYDITTHQLLKMNNNLMVPRTSGAAFKPYNTSQVMIFGGYNEIAPALNTAEQHTFMDSVSISSRAINPLNFRRKNFMSVYYNNAIYIFGGTNEFMQSVKPVEKLTLDPVAVEEKTGGAGAITGLKQNYPNPFGSSKVAADRTTSVQYTVAASSSVTIRIFSILGELVSKPVDGFLLPGTYTFTFDAAGLPAGIYVCEMTAVPSVSEEARPSANGFFRQTIKMMLLK